MCWQGVVFSLLAVALGYGLGASMTKTQMQGERFEQREKELEAINAERSKWIEHGREMERRIQEAERKQ